MLKKLWLSAWELLKFAIITVVVVVPIRTFVAQPFIVSGASMYPTFTDHEYLIVDELSYYLREPKRGEVIIFRYPKEPSKHFIKRVIGLPGEIVTVKNNQVWLSRGGQTIKLNEPYARGSLGPDQTVTLGNDEYFVLGDNRQVSLDSRSWGPLAKKFISGRAVIRLFPLETIALLPGSAAY